MSRAARKLYCLTSISKEVLYIEITSIITAIINININININIYIYYVLFLHRYIFPLDRVKVFDQTSSWTLIASTGTDNTTTLKSTSLKLLTSMFFGSDGSSNLGSFDAFLPPKNSFVRQSVDSRAFYVLAGNGLEPFDTTEDRHSNTLLMSVQNNECSDAAKISDVELLRDEDAKTVWLGECVRRGRPSFGREISEK